MTEATIPKFILPWASITYDVSTMPNGEERPAAFIMNATVKELKRLVRNAATVRIVSANFGPDASFVITKNNVVNYLMTEDESTVYGVTYNGLDLDIYGIVEAEPSDAEIAESARQELSDRVVIDEPNPDAERRPSQVPAMREKAALIVKPPRPKIRRIEKR